MSQNVLNQLASLLCAFSVKFDESNFELSGGDSKADDENWVNFKELSGINLKSEDKGSLNKLAYRIGSGHKSPFKTFLYNTEISSLQITSMKNEPLKLVDLQQGFMNKAGNIELVYKGKLKFHWIERDYYFYMPSGSGKSAVEKTSDLQVKDFKLIFTSDNQGQLLKGFEVGALKDDQKINIEMNAVLDSPINKLFGFLNLTATSLLPEGWGKSTALPLRNIQMVVG